MDTSQPAKLRYEIIPHERIGPIRLGMSRNEVAAVMAKEPGAVPCKASGDHDYFASSCLSVEYSPRQKASYIEASRCEQIAFCFERVSVFDVSAAELADHIKRFDQAHPAASEKDDYPLFPNLILSLGERRRDGPSRWYCVGIGDQYYLQLALKELESPFKRYWPQNIQPAKAEVATVAWLRELGVRLGIDHDGHIRRIVAAGGSLVNPFTGTPGPLKRAFVDDDFKRITELAKLEALGLPAQKNITDAAIGHIQGLQHLQALKVTATNLTGSAIDHMRGWTELRELALPDQITSGGLKKLTSLGQLTELRLTLQPGAEDGLIYLTQLPNLTAVDIEGVLTDAGMEFLSRIPHLQELGISNTNVTDQGLLHLKRCQTLTLLKRWFTKTTIGAAMSLREHLPDLRIYPSHR